MPGENFPGDRIVSLVDELEGLIEEAKPPFGKNAQFKVIDADVFFNILDEIRMSYPEEWQKSRRILKEREADRRLPLLLRPIPSSLTLSSRPSPLPVSRIFVRLAQQQADVHPRSCPAVRARDALCCRGLRRAGLYAPGGEPQERDWNRYPLLSAAQRGCRPTEWSVVMAEFPSVTVDLSEQLEFPGDSYPLTGKVDVATYTVGEKEYQLQDGIDYDVVFTNAGTGVLLTGMVRAHATGECDRCLEARLV